MKNKNYYLGQSNKTKARVFNEIVNHLFGATEDPRHRERLRTRVALRKIEAWTKLSQNLNYSKNIYPWYIFTSNINKKTIVREL